MTQPPHWLQLAQATGAIATTIGVLIALYVAVIREPRKAAEERRHHIAQMDALHRAEKERIAAQARKVVPSCVRTPMFGDSWWAVRIDNASHALTNILSVDVTALDTNGFEVSCGCRPANNTMPVERAFDRSMRAAISESLGEGLQRSLTGAFKQALRDAMVGQFVKEWPHTVPPNQHALMAYTTTNPNYTLCVTIAYEDEAGYQWRRTDTSQPERMDNGAPRTAGAADSGRPTGRCRTICV
jgi:hypothetical protein